MSVIPPKWDPPEDMTAGFEDLIRSGYVNPSNQQLAIWEASVRSGISVRKLEPMMRTAAANVAAAGQASMNDVLDTVPKEMLPVGRDPLPEELEAFRARAAMRRSPR